MAVWWAAWSLADTYLLDYSPCAELVVLTVCAAAAAVAVVGVARNKHNKRYRKADADEVDGEKETKSAELDSSDKSTNVKAQS